MSMFREQSYVIHLFWGLAIPEVLKKGNWVGLFIESVPIVTVQMLAWNKNKLLAQAISLAHLGKLILSQMFIDLSDTKRFGGLGC